MRDRSLVTIVALASMGDDDQLDAYSTPRARKWIDSRPDRGGGDASRVLRGLEQQPTKALTVLTRSLGK